MIVESWFGSAKVVPGLLMLIVTSSVWGAINSESANGWGTSQNHRIWRHPQQISSSLQGQGVNVAICAATVVLLVLFVTLCATCRRGNISDPEGRPDTDATWHRRDATEDCVNKSDGPNINCIRPAPEFSIPRNQENHDELTLPDHVRLEDETVMVENELYGVRT